MGISGLLPLLKSIHKNTTLKKFAGQTIGIDGYGWLHRGAVACAIELALDKPTTKYVDFAMSRVRMLLDFGITPYVVFDGDNLPSKAGTNEERRKRRDEAKALGLSLYKAGKTSQAYQELQKATGVSPYMARLLIEELKKLDVQYIVAPYEADAQLTYLERKGMINGVLSEDSDLLVYGVKRLITKLNQYGECVEIERADFPLCKDINLAGWTDAMFRRMAILSGCDYLPNIDKMGLKTAYRFVRKYKEAERAIKMIAFEGKFCVPQDYMEKFKYAELTFIHHRVFCPVQQKMVFLTDLERGMSEKDMPYLGHYVEPEVAIGVACGDLNPKNKQPIEVKVRGQVRPSLQENRRQTFGTPSDLKKGVSLDNFFKPHRTPLQELDPNSLTPSPSQQRLLERHRNASWEPRAVSSAPQLRRTVTSIAPSAGSIERRAFLARASTVSNYQPPKRQRLCSETQSISPQEEVQQSPFFATKTPLMSPLLQKKSRTRKARASFDVWSDDSVDDALLSLMAEHETFDSNAGPEKQDDTVRYPDLAVQAEEIDTVPQSSPVQSFDESQGPQYSNNGTQTALFPVDSGDVAQDTVICSIQDDDDSEAFEDLLEYHVRMQNEKIGKTFVAQPPRQRAAALQSLSSLKKRAASSPIIEKPDAFASIVVQDGSESQACEGTATDSSIVVSSSTASDLLKTFMYQSPDAQLSALQSLGKKQSDVEKIEIARAVLAKERRAYASGRQISTRKSTSGPGSVPTKAMYSNVRGSEDSLVPDSEEEVSGTDEESPKPSISLQNFAFTG